MKEQKNQLVILCKKIGYNFKKTDLLNIALRHSSFTNESEEEIEDYERLEFLGDAVLDLIIGEYLYRNLPEDSEGKLTRLRSQIVNEQSLAEIGRSFEIGKYLMLGKGEEESKGREKNSILANTAEAIIGAIFIDSDFETAKQVVLAWFSKELQSAIAGYGDTDHKSHLQEWVQKYCKCTPVYKLVEHKGPAHAREFTMAVFVNGVEWGQGSGPSKKMATQKAAEDAWDSHVKPQLKNDE